MEKFYYEIPTINRKDEAIQYIKEHIEYNSNVNGSGGLDSYTDNYEGWLNKLEEDYKRIPNEEHVPARTYFLIRENDNKIIGMLNIRTTLNKKLMKYGNIGYGIRPTERGKGYNKINLYLGLKVSRAYGLDNVLLGAYLDNVASWKTMEALGGTRINEYHDEETGHDVVDYSINVLESLDKYRDVYEVYVSDKNNIGV